jgi:hypothetical protein
MKFFVEVFPPGLMQCPLGRREIGADQVLVDLGEKRGVGVEAVADVGRDAIKTKLAERFEAMSPHDQPKTVASARANYDRLQESSRLDRFRDLGDLLRPQAAHAVRRNHNIADQHRRAPGSGHRPIGISCW